MSVIPGATARICEVVWRYVEGDKEYVIGWLTRIGCTDIVVNGDQVTFTGTTGMRSALTPSDPCNTAVILALAVAGVYWPIVFPDLLDTVNAQWREKKKVWDAQNKERQAQQREQAKRRPQQAEMTL